MGTGQALDGHRVVVVGRHDVGHPLAGEAEHYLHQIALRWAAWGTRVTWLTTGAATPGAGVEVDGVEVVRVAGLAGIRRWLARGGVDAVVDGLGDAGRLLPAVVGRRTPVVQVAHRVPAPDRRVTRTAARGALAVLAHRERTVVALSPTAGHDLRRVHRVRDPIVVVPPGADPVPPQAGRRAAVPTVAVVAPLVADHRLDVLVDALTAVVPQPRIEIVGDGPLPPRVARGTVTVHGGHAADAVLRRAWVTVSAAEAGVHGCAVLEAAARGVPCVGVATPGIRDIVRDGSTGWLVDTTEELATTVTAVLTALADPDRADHVARRCQAWAGAFRWERAARLLAAVVASRLTAGGPRRAAGQRRRARSDIATVARFPVGLVADPAPLLRATDEVDVVDDEVRVLLRGCDEVDAASVVERIGVPGARLRLAGRDDLLLGPKGLPAAFGAPPRPGQLIPVSRKPRG